MAKVSELSEKASKPVGSAFHRLYTGTGVFNFVGHRKVFYLVFGGFMLAALLSIVLRGFELGIDFKGGTKIEMPAASSQGVISTDAASKVFTDTLGHAPEVVQLVGTGDSASIQIRTGTLSQADATKVEDALFKELQPKDRSGQPSRQAISDAAVSGSWGNQITKSALIALAVFLVLVSVFLALYFERWMAIAALIALVHDLLITAGVYSIVGFEVSPATVTGLLTILGFSLYDTVVVFDKVKENTRGLLGLTRRTYGEAANLAVNQTLMRSINTTLIAILPVLGLLVVGVGVLGVGSLKDLALVQLTGMIAGALSSIFIATPLVVDLKMTEKAFQNQAQRVYARRANLARKAAAGEALNAAETSSDSTDEESLDAELRKERALTAAASVPARTGKVTDDRRAKAGSGAARSGRPSGKRRR